MGASAVSRANYGPKFPRRQTNFTSRFVLSNACFLKMPTVLPLRRESEKKPQKMSEEKQSCPNATISSAVNRMETRWATDSVLFSFSPNHGSSHREFLRDLPHPALCRMVELPHVSALLCLATRAISSETLISAENFHSSSQLGFWSPGCIL